MYKFFSRLKDAYRHGGFWRLAKAAYLRMRPHFLILPKKPVLFAGIHVGYRILPDALFSLHADIPNYELALVEGLRGSVRPGDRVLVIGCGKGVTASLAASIVGPTGHVTAYEGSAQQVRGTSMTFELNRVNNAAVHHAIVGNAKHVYGNIEEFGKLISPGKLPECDVLQMDCEGSELEILRSMNIRPRVILVETHGIYGAPTELVARVLTELGYWVTDMGWAEPHLLAECMQNDIRVLRGESIK